MVDLSKKEDNVEVRKMYAIYAGMCDVFGGKYFRCFDSYESEDDALEDAREIAIEEYESYKECHGVPNQDQCEEEGLSYEDEIYYDWIDYSAKEVSYEDIISISKDECLDLDCICDALNKLNLCNKIKTMEAE